MKEITAYQCDYCKKLFVRRINIEKHENTFCFYSPKSRSCGTCKHFVLHEGSEEYERPLHCELDFDKFINDYDETELIRYQKNCNAWERSEVTK
jgi:hypothetical protein